ncbi:glycosyl hydrolase family 8 [Pseudoroseomonas globiformis]|uniref:cellulase n=1 Tax=Teichococcus globiformis TaxID=2307229 RepID=A0ABV7FWN2_9PROT
MLPPRRATLAAALTALLPLRPASGQPVARPPPAPRSEWTGFKRLYMTDEGRVVDTANGGSSHSEGQGWALLLAEAFNDEAAFNRILGWSRRVLRRPGDFLLAWGWRPNRAHPVEDLNNATDGDVFMAWALERGARRWDRPELLELAQRIARDLHAACVRTVNGRHLLLPAAFGFEHRDHVVVNPSYYVMPAFGTLSRLQPEGRWDAVRRDGLALLREARFGRWGLPADWVRLPREGSTPPVPAPGWPPRFSYDAVRVPLYLAWAGLEDEPAAKAAIRFWDHAPQHVPAWTDVSQDSLAPYSANSGFQAIASLLRDRGVTPERLPRVADAPHYYAAALTLLACLAADERPPAG